MTESVEELAALYTVGALSSAETRSFERRLKDGWPEGNAALLDLNDAVRLLAMEEETPPPQIRSKLMASINTRIAATQIPGMSFHFAEDVGFRQTPHPGVTMRILHLDKENRRFTCLMRLAPGATLPSHPHDGPEECVVLDGEFTVFGVKMKKGDYQRAEPGRDHGDQYSETGALVYLSGPVSLLHE